MQQRFTVQFVLCTALMGTGFPQSALCQSDESFPNRLSDRLAPPTPLVPPSPQAQLTIPATKGSDTVGGHPLDAALAIVATCQERYATVFDYETRLILQERIGRRLMPSQDIRAKFRQEPFSVYFRWQGPEGGREALYVAGRDDDHVITHATGIRKALSGAERVDPDSPKARRESRHSLREAGIGHLIDKLVTCWEYERRWHETVVDISHVKVNERPCTLIEAVHPRQDDGKFMFHTVKVYVDKELMLPTRWEAYGYPETPGREPGDLLECCTYLDVRPNAGLRDIDFSTSNPAYDFSRW